MQDKQGEYSKIPLHQTLHFRKIRKLLTIICKDEEISLSDYDTMNIRAYRTLGCGLQSSVNVFCKVQPENTSCWVGNNHYEVMEIPKKSNKESFTGDFLILAKNTDYDYWVLAKMSHKVDYDETRRLGELVEKVKFRPYGYYLIVTNDDGFISITPTTSGRDCNWGGPQKKATIRFDNWRRRKKAYGIVEENYLNSLLKRQGKFNSREMIDTKRVEIYKKNKKKYRN